MHPQDRVGLRISELWVCPPDPAQTEQDMSRFGEPEEFIIVSASCQRSSVKQYFNAAGAFQVQLLAGSTVGVLRQALMNYLPADAKIMAEREGLGLVTLRDTDAVPLS